MVYIPVCRYGLSPDWPFDVVLDASFAHASVGRMYSTVLFYVGIMYCFFVYVDVKVLAELVSEFGQLLGSRVLRSEGQLFWGGFCVGVCFASELG